MNNDLFTFLRAVDEKNFHGAAIAACHLSQDTSLESETREAWKARAWENYHKIDSEDERGHALEWLQPNGANNL